MCEPLEITEKKCSKCGEVKPVSEFCKCNKVKSGLTAQCKTCDRKYRLENRETILIKQAKYRNVNSEKIKELQIKWYKKNSKKILIKASEYRLENRETIRIKKRKYRLKNSEKIRVKDAKYHLENRETILIKQAKYRNVNSEKIKENRIKNSNDITCVYVKNLISANYKISSKLITDELIELKRLQIQSKRILNLKN